MNLIKQNIRSVTAFAPATCANVAVGFDILGFAIENIGDRVTLTRGDDNDTKLTIVEIDSQEPIPLESDKNTASIGIAQMCRDLKLQIGFSITIHKGIPLSSGIGGSAASAVAALVACNAFLCQPLSNLELLQYAILGEEVISGHRHVDNAAASLYGGFTLIHRREALEIIPLPIPDLWCVIAHPHLRVATKQARQVLKKHVPLEDFVTQSANLAATIAALYRGDEALLQRALTDVLIEPQRAHFVPGFYEIKTAALQAGALAVSFSGSGPSLFALTKSKEIAEKVISTMRNNFTNENIMSEFWVSPISSKGAHIISQQEDL
jgi:homoserine kinase